MHKVTIRRDLSGDFGRALRHALLCGEIRIISCKARDLTRVFENLVEKLRLQFEKERERLKQEEKRRFYSAMKKGFSKGLKKAKELASGFLKDKERLFAEFEKRLMEMVVPICEKVLEQELKTSRSVILSIIREEIKRLCSDEITLLLNPGDLKIIKEIEPGFLKEMAQMRVRVEAADNLMPSECRIATDSGIIDASPRMRLERLSRVINAGD